MPEIVTGVPKHEETTLIQTSERHPRSMGLAGSRDRSAQVGKSGLGIVVDRIVVASVRMTSTATFASDLKRPASHRYHGSCSKSGCGKSAAGL